MAGKPKIIERGAHLSEEENEVIRLFVNGLSRREAYRAVFTNVIYHDNTIYNWWKLPKVQAQLTSYITSLDDYNLVCDKTLLDIIVKPNALTRDKIAAIKLWADLRNRIQPTLKIQSETLLDMSNVTDENLEKIIEAITANENRNT